MTGELAHFAINADDVEATKAFYEQVFGWRFTPWGPPDFFHIDTRGAEVAPLGALQRRRDLVPGERTIGFECTVSVPDVAVVAKAATAHGGRVVMDRTTITGVGDLVFVADPSGNVIGAMRYDDKA